MRDRSVPAAFVVGACLVSFAGAAYSQLVPPPSRIPRPPLVSAPPNTVICTEPHDRDRDGLDAIVCGGLDCDDNDRDRFPGNPERCDATGHDEDCDPCTVAFASWASGSPTGYGLNPDQDHDGFFGVACFNTAPGFGQPLRPPGCDLGKVAISGTGPFTIRGLDCDDTNRVIGPADQVCDGDRVKICNASATGAPWDTQACPAGRSGAGRCVPQPNGTGVCIN